MLASCFVATNVHRFSDVTEQSALPHGGIQTYFKEAVVVGYHLYILA